MNAALRRFGIALLVIAAARPGAFAQEEPGRAWTTLHGDLRRSGFYPSFPAGDLKPVWRKELWREQTGPRCEVIVGDGLAFLGTYAGSMYAWDARTGQERWRVATGGPIGHSPMLADGALYFGSMDRNLYAVAVRDGRELWRYTAGEGIWSSPAVAGGLVLFGARDGVFTALRARDGKPMWTFRTGDRILTSPAVTADETRIVFASEDMRVYCLDLRTGKELWRSRKMAGLSVRDYFPVLAHGLALVTTNPVRPFHTVLDEHQKMLLARTGFRGKDDRYIPATPEAVAKEQDAILAYLKQHPEDRTFYAFSLDDGSEPWTAPILYTAGLHNPPPPPCVNPITGDVYVTLRTAYGVWDGGGEVRPYTGVGRLDMRTGRVELIAHGHRSGEPGRPEGRKDMPWNSFAAIGDETQALSCAPGLLLANHQGALGALDLRTGLTRSLYGKRDTYGGFYGPGAFGWEDQGGRDRAREAGQPFGIVNEWHGPARSIVSAADGYVYYHTGAQVICLEATR